MFGSLRHKITSRRTVVLVVDDEREVREIEQAMLGQAGYEVIAAENGAHALSLVVEGQPVDIVVADLMMPEMDGTEMARQLRVVRPDVKVLFVTGYSDHLFEDHPWLWADVAFLDKPFTMNGLLEAVSTLLSGHVTRTAPDARVLSPRWSFSTATSVR